MWALQYLTGYVRGALSELKGSQWTSGVIGTNEEEWTGTSKDTVLDNNINWKTS